MKKLKDNEEWLGHTEPVTYEQNPPMLDESAHQRSRKLADGTEEVSYECEYCTKQFVTPAQLTGTLSAIFRPKFSSELVSQ